MKMIQAQIVVPEVLFKTIVICCSGVMSDKVEVGKKLLFLRFAHFHLLFQSIIVDLQSGDKFLHFFNCSAELLDLVAVGTQLFH